MVFTVVRIATKGQPTQAIAGLIGVLASAALALWTGDARDNYVLGFFTNAAYALALLISLLVRWPAIGLIVGFLMGDGLAWRRTGASTVRRSSSPSCGSACSSRRLLVQVPFYLVDNVEALGATRLLMGVPLYAARAGLLAGSSCGAVYPSSRTRRRSDRVISTSR